MNQVKHNLFSLFLLIIATIGVWHSPLGSYKAMPTASLAIAQASLIPAPSLQDEPAELLTSETNTLPIEVQSAVLNDAVKRTSKTVAAFKVLEAQPQQWSDGCLGLGKPEEICTQAITSGWRVLVTDGIKNWIYRTDDVGDAVRLE